MTMTKWSSRTSLRCLIATWTVTVGCAEPDRLFPPDVAPSYAPGVEKENQPADAYLKAAPANATAPSTGARCESMHLFMKQGLVEELAKVVRSAPHSEVVVPGALNVSYGYGGDWVQTVMGVRTTAAQVWSTPQGGEFSAQLAGHAQGDDFSRQAFAAAIKLFDSMSGAATTTRQESGWTIVARSSPGWRVRCEKASHPAIEGGSLYSADCTLTGVLFTQPSARVLFPGELCPGS